MFRFYTPIIYNMCSGEHDDADFFCINMNIKVNRKDVVTEARTLSQLVAEMSLPEKGVAVAIDANIVKRQIWDVTTLCEGMNITVIKAAFVG